ncbi:MAG: sulfatase-like hydrolase/transferase [Thermoanaerobaculia bacterium]
MRTFARDSANRNRSRPACRALSPRRRLRKGAPGAAKLGRDSGHPRLDRHAPVRPPADSPYEPPEPHASRYRGREYDGAIAFADELVGRFLDFLKKRGLYDRALVVVLSDHGEGLGEHGLDEHGLFLYRYALQVPMMWNQPKGEMAGTSIAVPVQLTACLVDGPWHYGDCAGAHTVRRAALRRKSLSLPLSAEGPKE